jgi:hypothetical protein
VDPSLPEIGTILRNAHAARAQELIAHCLRIAGAPMSERSRTSLVLHRRFANRPLTAD